MRRYIGNEDPQTAWRPAVATGASHDHPSASVIFKEQCLNSATNKFRWAPGALLFGHACGGGGVIFRPSKVKILCGHDRDYGARCEPFCPHIDARATSGPTCKQAWAPTDVGACASRGDAARHALLLAYLPHTLACMPPVHPRTLKGG
jgi:hypothetical protein